MVEHAPVVRRASSRGLILAVSAVAFALAAVLSIGVGPTGISLDALPQALRALLTGHATDTVARQQLVLIDLRLPRTLIGAFVGAALALAGAMMQGLFRNPLADPSLVGVSSGAALAAVATIAFDGWPFSWSSLLGIYALPVAAFLGGVSVTLLLSFVAGRGGSLMMSTLLLAGIAFGALAGALTGLIAYVSNDQKLRDLTLWSMGSLSGASWEKVLAILPFAILLALMIPRTVHALNALLLGESEAFHLGVDVEATKRLLILLTALAVGASVAVAGVIGFVGLVVPHFVRLLGGTNHALVLPASALLGATLLVTGDVIARVVVMPAELPIGIVMAVVGAPVFLHLVLRRGRGSG